jgi:uncharacterized coiled-coil protein SlyX
MALTTTNPNSRPIVTTETSAATGVSIAIDYTTYYDRIATALETIATNSTAIKNSLAAIDTDFDTLKTQLTTIATQSTTIATQQTTIAAQTTTIATKQTEMETYQKKLKELAEDKGVRIISPYEYLTLIQQYKSLVEEGNVLKAPTIQKSATKEARAKINDYIESIKDLPTIKD